jgi:hypothetical protein
MPKKDYRKSWIEYEFEREQHLKHLEPLFTRRAELWREKYGELDFDTNNLEHRRVWGDLTLQALEELNEERTKA